MLTGDVSDPARYAGDIVRDPVTSWCSRNYWPLAASTFALPYALGWILGGPAEALSCLVWAGFVRVVFLQHVTWAIASLGHTYGEKLPNAKDESRNSVLLAVLLFGEGLHSFHHMNPSAGVNQPAHLDLNGAILSRWERWGWISELRRST